MHHDLKIWPQYYEHVESGTKTFEVRKNDRGFQPGDTVHLREWDPTNIYVMGSGPGLAGGMSDYEGPRGYTDRSLKFKVGYVLPIDAERVVFSLLPAPTTPEAGKGGEGS